MQDRGDETQLARTTVERGAQDLRRRGRPRSEKARAAILAAASELLLERGPSSMSMDAVADRAGASKATIYRWWPSKELLALDALFREWEAGMHERYDTGSLSGDLLALILPWSRQLAARPYGPVIAFFVLKAQTDPVFAAEYRDRFVERRREEARAIFARSIERGEVRPEIDVEAALDVLYGPFYHRILHGHASLSDSFAHAVVQFVVAGVCQGGEAS